MLSHSHSGRCDLAGGITEAGGVNLWCMLTRDNPGMSKIVLQA